MKQPPEYFSKKNKTESTFAALKHKCLTLMLYTLLKTPVFINAFYYMRVKRLCADINEYRTEKDGKKAPKATKESLIGRGVLKRDGAEILPTNVCTLPADNPFAPFSRERTKFSSSTAKDFDLAEQEGLKEPVFENKDSFFRAVLYRGKEETTAKTTPKLHQKNYTKTVQTTIRTVRTTEQK